MNFKKDILLIDEETTGLNADKHEIIQLSGILLDKKTLKEKKTFNSYIKPRKWKQRDPRAMKVNQISWNVLKDADYADKVIEEFNFMFPAEEVVLAAYVGFNDKRFLLEAYRKAKVEWKFDYHYFDLWGVFYIFCALKGLLKSKKDFVGFGLDSLMKHFKIEIDGRAHDALTDCRMEAEILRRVVKEIK